MQLSIHSLWLGRYWHLLLICSLIHIIFLIWNFIIKLYEGFALFRFLCWFNIMFFCKFIKVHIFTFHNLVCINIQALVSLASCRVAKKYSFIALCIKFSIPIIFKNVTLASKYLKVFYIAWIFIPQFKRGRMCTFLDLYSVKSVYSSTYSFPLVF